MRLRGKTLDLTKLGIISKPRVRIDITESPKPKSSKKQQAKTQSRGVTPRKAKRKDSLEYQDEQVLTQRSDRKSQHSQERISLT